MARLEELTPGARVRGILPERSVDVLGARWHGTASITLTFRDDEGRVANRRLHRNDERSLAVESPAAASPFVYEGKTASQWIPEVIERLRERFDPLKIILFGSHARGDVTRYSDIDLLVVLPSIGDKRRAMSEMLIALADLPAPVDAIPTDPDEIARRGHLAGTILYPALREGRVVYERAR